MSLRQMSLLLLPLMLTACATIIEGNDQTVSVITYPPDARCELARDGNAVAFVNPTPGTVSLEKSSADVTVRCTKDGHFDGLATLSSSLQGMTFGNLLFGGIIGVAVDASSGAMHEYQASVTVVLPPKRFADMKARDAFFDRQMRRIETEATTTITKARKVCQRDEQDCDALVEAINAERDAKLQELAAQKESAQVN